MYVGIHVFMHECVAVCIYVVVSVRFVRVYVGTYALHISRSGRIDDRAVVVT